MGKWVLVVEDETEGKRLLHRAATAGGLLDWCWHDRKVWAPKHESTLHACGVRTFKPVAVIELPHIARRLRDLSRCGVDDPPDHELIW
jgi:hypothetical protein